jgi:signal transduction histidine kinase
VKHFCQAQRSALERIALIVRRLLTFSRAPSHTSWNVVRVSRLLEEAQALLRHRLAKLTLDLPPPSNLSYGIRGDELGLVQVLVNLLNNAVDVTPEGGRVEVAVEAIEAGRVAISVIDQGPGVSEDVARKLFTPFFTTKEHGKGTGLGLAVSRNIVQEHGGEIEFENLESPGGARFTVTLPLDVSAEPSAGQQLAHHAERECPVTT